MTDDQVYGVDTSALDEITARLEEEERDLGLQYVGKDKAPNRAQRREAKRAIDRVTRRPMALTSLKHPLLDTLTPAGARRLKRRRAKSKVAKQSRKRNRRTR